MFGLIIPSRPLLPFTTISPTQYAITVPTAPSFTHIAVFLLPGGELPALSAAAIYISFGGAGGPFRFLGALTPDKQSALFQVKGGEAGRDDTAAAAAAMQAPEVDMDADEAVGTETTPMVGEVMLGVAIEAAEEVAARLAARTAVDGEEGAPSMALTLAKGPLLPQPSTKVLAQRIIRNAFNFLASFAATEKEGGELVPLKSFQDWWTKFEHRIEVDPGFLERSGD